MNALSMHAAATAPVFHRRVRLAILPVLLGFLLCGAFHADAQEVPAPALANYITDQAGVLPPDVTVALNEKLALFERETSTQIAVVVLPTLGGEAIEDASYRFVEKNKLGRKGKDNGILLLVVRDDRKIRIEVGRGLEGVLTDALSSQIIRKEIVPHFRVNDYPSGIAAGVDALMRATRNEYTADPESGKSSGPGIGPIVVMLIIIFIVTRLRSSGIRRGGFPPFGGGFGGGSFGGGGGFGGGSFGGGGGSFGGGGASGSW
jgi:uncharacterized protein